MFKIRKTFFMFHFSNIRVPNRKWSIKKIGKLFFWHVNPISFIYFFSQLEVQQIQIFVNLKMTSLHPVGPLISFLVKKKRTYPIPNDLYSVIFCIIIICPKCMLCCFFFFLTLMLYCLKGFLGYKSHSQFTTHWVILFNDLFFFLHEVFPLRSHDGLFWPIFWKMGQNSFMKSLKLFNGLYKKQDSLHNYEKNPTIKVNIDLFALSIFKVRN